MEIIMKKKIFLIASFLGFSTLVSAFCGFYVSTDMASLFNKSSQVIVVRSNDRSTITMSSDFQGDVKDFAMVIPVPVVISKSDIKLVNQSVFDKLNAYSMPRLAEYHDPYPCGRYFMDEEVELSSVKSSSIAASADMVREVKKEKSVKIEATYTVGEYDIIILSAKESDGLQYWLEDNGYKIPAKAQKVLEPYVKSNMKFFVVKVNLKEFGKDGFNVLRPIQITFESPKFMLPIRLGMANANGPQDMIVYMLTEKGRVETSNYRTVKIPTDRNIPLTVKSEFKSFYDALYKKAYEREGKNVVFLEYSWDLNSSNFVKCDPCASTPPVYADLKEAGVWWLADASRQRGFGGYEGNLHFTRLHVTYDRENFPMDLMFQETPDKQNFQGRYVVHNPAIGPFECREGKKYLTELRQRRYKEVNELSYLTGWRAAKYQSYIYEFEEVPQPQRYDDIQDEGRMQQNSGDDKDRVLNKENRVSKQGSSEKVFTQEIAQQVKDTFIALGDTLSREIRAGIQPFAGNDSVVYFAAAMILLLVAGAVLIKKV